jgi:secreted trypsin-like serine protease
MKKLTALAATAATTATATALAACGGSAPVNVAALCHSSTAGFGAAFVQGSEPLLGSKTAQVSALATAADDASCLAAAGDTTEARSARAASPQIVGGTPVPNNALPALVMITDNGYLCTGTVVSSNVVLTAGHCADQPPANYTVNLTDTVPAGDNWPTSTVSQVLVDPGYDPANDYTDDAALLVLSTPISTTPMSLAADAPATGASASMAGFGATQENSGVSYIANEAPTIIQSLQFCLNFWGAELAASDLCAVDAPADDTSIGAGDSGGPLMVGGIEVGINDRADSTYSGSSPSIFTSVALVDPWVQSEITAVAPPAPKPTPAPPKSKSKPKTSKSKWYDEHYRMGGW